MRRRLSSSRRRAFTLIEVMLGVAIISMLIFSVYRFVSANLTAIRSASQVNADRAALVGLVDFVQMQLEDLPMRGPNVLKGRTEWIRDQANGWMEWPTSAGAGMMTTAAPEDYTVRLVIQPVEKNTTELAIGLQRRVLGSQEKDYDWLPLLRPATELLIEFWDPRLMTYVPRWDYTDIRPPFVRVTIKQTAEDEPYVAVLTVPSANVNVR